jgi:hypothetical protein
LDQTGAPTADLPLEVSTLTIVPLMGFIWQEHVTFDEIMFMSALYYTNTFSWIMIVLAHWINNPQVDISLHITLTLSQPIVVFGSTRLGIEAMIYHTCRKHTDHYTTKTFFLIRYQFLYCNNLNYILVTISFTYCLGAFSLFLFKY